MSRYEKLGIGEAAALASLVVFFIISIFSGGCGVEWRVVDGAVAYADDDLNTVTAKSLVVRENPGWLWCAFGWKASIRIWNASESTQGWYWVADSGHGVLSIVKGGGGSTRGTIRTISAMWDGWYVQQQTGIGSVRSEEAEILEEAQRLLNKGEIK